MQLVHISSILDHIVDTFTNLCNLIKTYFKLNIFLQYTENVVFYLRKKIKNILGYKIFLTFNYRQIIFW